MSYRRAGGALAASVFAISTVVTPFFEADVAVKAATKAKLNKTETELVVGEATKLKLKGAKATKFETSDKKIATVNKSGKVKAKKAGTATITVYDEKGNVYKCKVTVSKKNKTVTTHTGNIDLGGMEIIIRDWWSPYPDSTYASEPQNAYEESVEKYREEMMKKYNFKIKEAGISDWGNAGSDFINYVTSGGDDNNYVFTLHYDENVNEAFLSGMMYDLSTLDCLDFSEEKFLRNKVHEKYTYGSSIYAFYSGYSEPRTGVYFNKQVLRNAGIDPDSIYEAQKKGTWTWDMFEKLMDKCQRDLDGDGVDDVYGLTLNETNMIEMAVASNGGAFIGKDKKGKFTYELESAETVEALKWCVEMFNKFDNHTSVDKSWDYYKEEFKEGKAAFMVDLGYVAENYGEMSCTDFDMGFVVFPKGPKAKNYVSLFDDNFQVIPACYDADRAWKIAFAWNLYTNPVKGYEDYNTIIGEAEKGNFDQKALNETIPLMSKAKTGVVTYERTLPGIDIGIDLIWNIMPNADVDAIIEYCSEKWKKAVNTANKKIK